MNKIEVKLPEEFIPIEDMPTDFLSIALWYLRRKLVDNLDPNGMHVCKKCGYELHFSNGDVKGDPYIQFVTCFCNQCRVRSDNHVYPKYNHSVVEFAEGALTDAINYFERKVMMK
mgnify:CR=1 FL=1